MSHILVLFPSYPIHVLPTNNLATCQDSIICRLRWGGGHPFSNHLRKLLANTKSKTNAPASRSQNTFTCPTCGTVCKSGLASHTRYKHNIWILNCQILVRRPRRESSSYIYYVNLFLYISLSTLDRLLDKILREHEQATPLRLPSVEEYWWVTVTDSETYI